VIAFWKKNKHKTWFSIYPKSCSYILY